MLTPTGSTLGWPEVQFQNASYIFYYCATFFFLFSHQIIAKQLLSTWLPIRECHCHQPDLLSDVETQTVNTSFIFTKKSNVAKCFFDICTAEMAQSLSSLQKSESLKLIILIFHAKRMNNQCELDVRVITCNFWAYGFFFVFFHSNSFIFKPKVEKIYIGVFPTHFLPLISILAKKNNGRVK